MTTPRTPPVCPSCKEAMQPGYLLDRYDNNRRRPVEWAQGAPEPGFWMGLKLGDRLTLEVRSWRCPSCGLLANYALPPGD